MPRPLELVLSVVAATIGAATVVMLAGASPLLILPAALAIGTVSLLLGHRRERV